MDAQGSTLTGCSFEGVADEVLAYFACELNTRNCSPLLCSRMQNAKICRTRVGVLDSDD